jgi:hypothetical protein
VVVDPIQYGSHSIMHPKSQRAVNISYDQSKTVQSFAVLVHIQLLTLPYCTEIKSVHTYRVIFQNTSVFLMKQRGFLFSVIYIITIKIDKFESLSRSIQSSIQTCSIANRIKKGEEHNSFASD